MYDKLLSSQWIFDRCVEISTLSFPIIIFIFILSVLLVYKFGLILRFNVVLRIIISLIFAVFVSIFLFFAGLLVGYGVLKCSAGDRFWPGVNYAHEIHAIMKRNYQQTQKWPSSERELKELGPDLYKSLFQNVRTSYVYNMNGSYTCFVRPSRYYVFVFDSEKDYGSYRLSNFFSFGYGVDLYPPKYDGPWDKLPE